MNAIGETLGDEHRVTRELERRAPATAELGIGFDDENGAHGTNDISGARGWEDPQGAALNLWFDAPKDL
jgi:hypothetical protein